MVGKSGSVIPKNCRIIIVTNRPTASQTKSFHLPSKASLIPYTATPKTTKNKTKVKIEILNTSFHAVFIHIYLLSPPYYLA